MATRGACTVRSRTAACDHARAAGRSIWPSACRAILLTAHSSIGVEDAEADPVVVHLACGCAVEGQLDYTVRAPFDPALPGEAKILAGVADREPDRERVAPIVEFVGERLAWNRVPLAVAYGGVNAADDLDAAYRDIP